MVALGRIRTRSMIKEKNTLNKILFSPALLSVLGLAVIIIISIPLARNISKQYKINKEVEELENEISELENQNNKLGGLIEYLESDQFIDEKARLNLNYKKEGEEVVIIKEKEIVIDDSAINLLDADKNNNKNASNPKKWWNYFFNH